MEKLPERFVKELDNKALDFDTEHLNTETTAYDICPGDAFKYGALWVMERFGLNIQYIADGSTYVSGHKYDSWKPGI